MRSIFSFLSTRRPSLWTLNDRPQQLTIQYTGGFRLRGLSIFDEHDRLRGFVSTRERPSPAWLEASVAAARRDGVISDELRRALFACIRRDDFVLTSARGRDLVLFPADIYCRSDATEG